MADRTRMLILAGCAAAIVAGVYEWQRNPEVPGDEALRKIEPLPPLEVPPQAISSLAAYEAIVERPLFNPQRRPPAPDQVTDDAATRPVACGNPRFSGHRRHWPPTGPVLPSSNGVRL